MSDIETRLNDLAEAVDYPLTPDFVAGLRRRLDAQPHRSPGAQRPRRPVRWRRAAVVAVVVLALLATALALPPTREGLARLFGIRGVSVQRQPSPLPSDIAGAPVDRGSLGPTTTLAEAQQAAGIAIKPPARGAPDEVRTRQWNTTTAITLVYNPGPSLPDPRTTGVGMLISAFHAAIDRELFGKTVGPDTTVDEVKVASGTGYWIHGSPHLVVMRLANGDTAIDTLRLAGNTLVWQDGEVTYRLESSLSRDQAIEVASSMH